jgi:hypothetical protein
MIFGSRVERRWLNSEIVLQGIGFKVIFIIRFKEDEHLTHMPPSSTGVYDRHAMDRDAGCLLGNT